MSASDDDVTRAIRDARILLDIFVKSPWRSLEVGCGPMHLALSRLSAEDRAASHASKMPASEAPASDVVDEGSTRLTAPHVATLRDLAAVGATIRAGEPYATLELLDEPVVLRADRDMRPVSLLSHPGALVEFGSPLMTVELTLG